MKANFLYRGINAKMYREANGELTPKGIISEANLYLSNNLVPSNTLMLGQSKKNAMDKHQHPKRQFEENFKKNSAYLSTTPIFDIAKKYATNNNKVEGYVFVIDQTKLVDYNVYEYLVSDVASMISVPEDKEVLLLTNPHGERLDPRLILAIKEVK